MANNKITLCIGTSLRKRPIIENYRSLMTNNQSWLLWIRSAGKGQKDLKSFGGEMSQIHDCVDFHGWSGGILEED